MAERKDHGTARRARAAQQREARLKAERRSKRLRVGSGVGAVAAVIALVLVLVFVHSGGKSSPKAAGLGPEGITLETGTTLAGLDRAAAGGTVDGISCDASEQVAYHIHTHLAIYVDGILRPVPPGVGTVKPVAQQSSSGAFYGASSCYYWLHVHAQDGIIHVESPTKATYTLGQFFAIWGEPLSATTVAGSTGKVTTYVDGKIYTGDPATITLSSREDVQLDVGTVVAPQPVDWSASQL